MISWLVGRFVVNVDCNDEGEIVVDGLETSAVDEDVVVDVDETVQSGLLIGLLIVS